MTDTTPENTTDELDNTTNDEQQPPTRDERRDERTRQRLRDVENERDALRAALLPHVRSQIEQLAAERLASGGSLWLDPSADPLALVGADFTPDVEKVAAVVDRLLQHAPQLAQRTPSFDSGARGSTTGTNASWHRLIDGARG